MRKDLEMLEDASSCVSLEIFGVSKLDASMRSALRSLQSLRLKSPSKSSLEKCSSLSSLESLKPSRFEQFDRDSPDALPWMRECSSSNKKAMRSFKKSFRSFWGDFSSLRKLHWRNCIWSFSEDLHFGVFTFREMLLKSFCGKYWLQFEAKSKPQSDFEVIAI